MTWSRRPPGAYGRGSHKVRELAGGRWGVVVEHGRERSSTILATFDTRQEAIHALPKFRRAQWAL